MIRQKIAKENRKGKSQRDTHFNVANASSTASLFPSNEKACVPLITFKKIPILLRKTGACVVVAAGLWNVLWYGLQHFTEFWGMAALVSGVLMITTAAGLCDVVCNRDCPPLNQANSGKTAGS